MYGGANSRHLGTHLVHSAAQELTTNSADSRTNVAKKLYRQRLPERGERDKLIDEALRAVVVERVAANRDGKFRRFLTHFVCARAHARDTSR